MENRIAILCVPGYKNPMFHPQFYVVPILIRIDTKLRVGCSSRLRDKGFVPQHWNQGNNHRHRLNVAKEQE